MHNHILSQSFYALDTPKIARNLLGKRLVRRIDNQRVSGIISDTEAYQGEEDQACHARVGLTRRTAVMYGPPGHAYIYFTYGMHWLLNFVTEEEGRPAAVLIRTIVPNEGIPIIAKNRKGKNLTEWCNGPAKLCAALEIDGRFNGANICENQDGLWVEDYQDIPDCSVVLGPRVGINSVPEPWKSINWRYQIIKSTINEIVFY